MDFAIRPRLIFEFAIRLSFLKTIFKNLNARLYNKMNPLRFSKADSKSGLAQN